MSDRIKTAADLFDQGFSCSQAVFAAFCGPYGLDETMALKLSCGLGGGVKHGGICGAVSGAVLIVGLKYGHTDGADKEGKALCGAKTVELLNAFRQRNNHLTCRDILGCDVSTEAGRQQALEQNLFKTVCVDMVTSAAEILEASGY